MYDQTPAGRERDMDVGTPYDTTSRPTTTGYSDPEATIDATAQTVPIDPQTVQTETGTYTEQPTQFMPTGAATTGTTGPVTDESAQTGEPSQSTGLKEQAAGAMRTGAEAATTAAQSTAQTAREQAREVADEVTTQARGIAGDLREQIANQIGRQHGTIVAKLREASDDMRQMAEGRDQTPATSLVSNLADRTNRFADHLLSRGPEGVLSEVQEFARRRPGTFLLAAAAAGFVVGRMAKSTVAASRAGSDAGREYQSAYQAGTGDARVGFPPGTAGYPGTPATGTGGTDYSESDIPGRTGRYSTSGSAGTGGSPDYSGTTGGTPPEELIRDDDWQDPRAGAAIAPSTLSGTGSEPGGPIPSAPASDPMRSTSEGGRP